MQIAAINPRTAILEAWQGIESAVRTAAIQRIGGSPMPDISSPLKMVRALAQTEVINSKGAALFHDLSSGSTAKGRNGCIEHSRHRFVSGWGCLAMGELRGRIGRRIRKEPRDHWAKGSGKVGTTQPPPSVVRRFVLHLSPNSRQRGLGARDFGEDVIGAGSPDERLGILVVMLDVLRDGLLEIVHAGEAVAAQAVLKAGSGGGPPTGRAPWARRPGATCIWRPSSRPGSNRRSSRPRADSRTRWRNT